MTSEIQRKPGGQISVLIADREPLHNVDFPTAIKALDQAYTEEMAELINSSERCLLALDAAIAQLDGIRRTMESINARARARHLEGTAP